MADRMDPSCIFCKIAAHEAPAKVVHEDEHVLAFQALNPAAPLHVLVIPKTHVASLSETDALVAGRLAVAAAKVAKDAGHAERGYRVLTNVGPDGGQSVFHLHFHVLAGRSLGWPPG
jgi:histidine triad (HIT) family protein